MSVARKHRFSPSHPCPVCGGHDRMQRGNSERCFGFSSEDGTWAHCTREEYAGELEYSVNTNAYVHKLSGDCRCGVRHDSSPQTNGYGQGREIEKTYDYRDADGKVLFQVVRYFPKGFRQRRPDGVGGWIWNLEGVKRVLYRLPGLLAADEQETVYVVEGEKDADRLAALGLVATTNPGGAKKWRREYTALLEARRVAIIPDNDEEGREHANRVAAQLHRVAACVKVVALPGLKPKGDASNWLNAGGTAEELLRLVEQAPEWEPATRDDGQGSVESVQVLLSDVNSEPSESAQKPIRRVSENPERHPAHGRIFTAAELLGEELPELKWAVPSVVPEGVTLLAGKPKMGKSWLALGLCIATATGGYALGKKRVEQGTSLYLALEDNRRRLQQRLRKLLPDGEAPERLHIATEWSPLDQGGAEELRAWLEEHADARLVVVDTLKKVRPKQTQHRNVYDVDYEALEPLLPLAAEHEVAIVVVHHLRQMPAADPLDEISGSTGLTGAVDGALVLRRDRGSADACLHVTGRDIEEEAELALRWERDLASWTLLGDAEEYRMSGERREIYALLSNSAELMSPMEIAEALGKSAGAVKMLLGEMLDDGQVEKPRYGKYTIPDSADSPDSPADNWSGVSGVSQNRASEYDDLGEEHRAELDATLAEKVRDLMAQDNVDGEKQ